MNRFLFFIAFIEMILVSMTVNGADLPAEEQQFLSDFMDMFPGIAEDPDSGWTRGNETKACDENWNGVHCENGDHITLFILITPGRGWRTDYTGGLPSSITSLSQLAELAVVANWTEQVPFFLLNITTLKSLTYSFPNRSVSKLGLEAFPNWALQFPLQETLTLDHHNFAGQVPDFSSMISTITSMNLVNNDLAGPFPDFSRCKDMYSFIAYGNKFNGTIPDWLNSNFTKLETLHVGQNQLSGNIPPGIAQLPALMILDLSHNNLTRNASVLSNKTDSGFSCLLSFNDPSFECSNATVPVCCSQYLSSPSATTTISSTATTATTTTIPTTGSCSGYICTCSSDLSGISSTAVCNAGTWIINGAATNNKTVTVAQGDSILINGSLQQSSQGSLQIYTNATQGGSVQVNGTASLGGSLVIVVTSGQTGTTTLQILNATTITGKFDDLVVVKNFDESSCRKTIITPSYSETAVTVLIAQSKKDCGDKGRIIGIAVGAGVGGLFLLLIVLVIILVILQKTGKCSCLPKTQKENFDYHTTSEDKL